MKIGIAIICRYNSSRLPGKILKEINGVTVLDRIAGRIQRAGPRLPLVVATSTDNSDDPIVEHCNRVGLTVFRGDLEDVAGRFLDCAQTYNWDFVVRINGDNLFLDVRTLAEMIAIASTDLFDFVSNVPGRTFPYGMSVEILRTSFYKEALAKMKCASYREHVTSWLYENPEFGKRFVHKNSVCPQAAGVNLALDTEADLQKAKAILNFGNAQHRDLDLSEIYNFLNEGRELSFWSGDCGPLLIAEIGGNHEGDFEVAKEMAQLAIDSGSDCVKFQLYTGDTLVSSIESPARNQHFKNFELSKDQHLYLAEMCRSSGVSYNASVWDLQMLSWIDEYLDFYKIGSGDLTAWPVIKAFAERGKPILLSTGLATLQEVLETVGFIQGVNPAYMDPNMLCIMQCTSMYPIPLSDANLNVMRSYHDATGLAVGYSDHTEGMDALRVAAAMGASVLEYHFTNSREGKEFRDHKVSLTPEEVLELKIELGKIAALKGSGIKRPVESELENDHHISFRRAVYLNRDVQKGEVISESDLVYLRPAHGTDARDSHLVVGATALCDIKAHSAIVHKQDYDRQT